MNRFEKDLIERIKKGDKKAFESLFKSYYTDLLKYACGFTQNINEAEDLVEDCFFWIWEKREFIRIDLSISAYLFTIVNHKCLNFLEKEKRHVQYIEIEKKLQSLKIKEDPWLNFNSKELAEIISNAIQNLPDQCRKIFEMNRFEGYKYREIADKLNISITTVKTQMSRALEKLRDELKDYI